MMFFAPFIAWIGTVLASLIAWIAAIFGKKIAVALAASSIWVIVAGVLILALNAIVTPLIQSMPGGLFSAGINMLPSNSTQCVGAILATHAACFVFELENKFINFKARA